MLSITWSVLVGGGESKAPTTKEGLTTTKSMPLSFTILHASFSAIVLAYAYHSYKQRRTTHEVVIRNEVLVKCHP